MPSSVDTSTKYKLLSRNRALTEGDEIVISGMSGKFPNCHNIKEYQEKLYNKIDMVDDDERRWRHFNPEIPKRSGKIYELEKFDATFFGVHFKQAHTMDPQTRILIEAAYEAVIDAGINPISIRGSKTGVFIGSCISESEKTWFYEKVSSGGFGITGCSRAMMANRISYCLGLEGPSFLLDTACSSSMYALDNAFSAIRNGEVEAAIIGGSNLLLHPFVTLQFARLGVLAADGYCRPFDKDASGYTRSEAINCLFLQKKKDAKRIYAEVVYSKTNCDGYKPEGITYPSGRMQEKLLQDFYNEIEITPNDLGYLEAHSTGTVVGDPEECRAIDNTLCNQRQDVLLVGSVKSNVGHSEAASGICSLVKACLALESGLIAPNINFNEIKATIAPLVEGRLKVVTEVTPLPKPIIGINSFGFGGANAHALLKACTKEKLNAGLPEDDIPRLVLWAGRSEAAVDLIFEHLKQNALDADFIGLLHNIQAEEVPGMVFRGYTVLKKCIDNSTTQALQREVQHYTGIKRPIVWVFSGMGSQWVRMGAALLIIPEFRRSIELCRNVLLPKGIDLLTILTAEAESTFDNILNSFVGIAAIQIALTDILRLLKLQPDFIIGHSVGELGCGYADGGLTREQMLLAAYYRGKVSVEIDKIKGSMAAIGIGYNNLKHLVPATIDIACHNGADSCTISGPAPEVAQFVTELTGRGIFAKKVASSDIAYHSRYIAHMGPQLLGYLRKIIPQPKLRTAKWLSSSVPKANWEVQQNNYCSAEYHTNNLLSSVLFEETFDLLPKNALTIEIAPHGLLQAILKRSMPNGVHIPLAQRGSKDNALVFMTALGRLFLNGFVFPIAKLYPEIQFPVARGTPSLNSLIRWDHSEDWFVTKYENMKTKSSGERVFSVNLSSDNEEFMNGHIIDGKILVPATCYLQFVWETFSLMYHGPSYMDVAVEFEDVRFQRATNMSLNSDVDFNVMIHYGTGNFEITESGALVVSGRITEIENPSVPEICGFNENSRFPMMQKKDFYKELKLRGYHYSGPFQAIAEARGDGLYGKIEWNYNWVTFMDAMLQIHILGTDSRSLLLPTRIRKLRINGVHHFNIMTEMDAENRLFNVYVDHEQDRIVAGGIEFIGVRASPVQRRRLPACPVLEKYVFLPYLAMPKLCLRDAARVFVQISLEVNAARKLKFLEIDTNNRETILKAFAESVDDLPLASGDYIHLSKQNYDEIPGVRVEKNSKLESHQNCHIIIVGALKSAAQPDTAILNKCLVDNGFLIVRSNGNNFQRADIPVGFNLIAAVPLSDNDDDDDETLILMKAISKNITPEIVVVVEATESDTKFGWISQMQSALQNKNHVIVYAYNEPLNGILGMVNCIRKEPDGNLVTCFIINDKNAPSFDLAHAFYAAQLSNGMPINILQDGNWGTYRHLLLPSAVAPAARKDHIYGNVMHRGDLSSLRWFEGPLNVDNCSIRIAYSSINFRDLMLATGRLTTDLYGTSRFDQHCVLGFEYSGINLQTGKRIMSMVIKGGVGSHVDKPSKLIWDIPEHWTLAEGATVPVVYITVYYAFFMSANIKQGKSILIHAGTGGVGLAAIRVALAYNLEVYTTCSTPEKRKFLLKTFPQLKESHIGNSRDTSFELLITKETKGQGVDFVLNSLAEDKLLASVRCLGKSGHFLEIGKFDMANDSKLGMSCFLKEITFHAVLADSLLYATDADIMKLKTLIDCDIRKGIIQPLPVTLFPAHEIEQAFRFLVGGKHMGKVVIQMRESAEKLETLPVKVLKQVYFEANLVYIIAGGLGGFGMELADWMVLRGARKLLLISRKGITKDYQSYRITLWATYGCRTIVSTADITKQAGCMQLMDEATKFGAVGGIFNLAVELHDNIFANQTEETFRKSLAPKAQATQHLDQLSRALCPLLQHFVVFSSVSCGRGNAGQTNYGMANAVMERIIEDRVKHGFPGKAIQWGAVGEVGLVAEMLVDKIDADIGGTLQQRIASCLEELDNLLTADAAIVASMVVAEKRSSRLGKESITETVMNIMGIRDLKTISLSTTLSEMGMDSLMAVEIKQVLERDFELSLTAQDLRSLTFQKLQMHADACKSQTDDPAKSTFTLDENINGIDLLLRNLGDEENCEQIMLPLKTADISLATGSSPNIIIPGLEGTAGKAWYHIGNGLKNKAVLLQLHKLAELETVADIAAALFAHIKGIMRATDPFYIIGYSYGTFVALELAAIFEKAGYRGQVVLIDGSPHFLKKLTLLHLGANFTTNDLYDLILSSIVNQIFPKETKESAILTFKRQPSVPEKMAQFMKFVELQKIYSREYSEKIVHAMYRRVAMVANFNLQSITQLKSPITLIRPSEVSLQDIDEDYLVSKITTGKVVLRIIDGNHSTMLDNPLLIQILNDFDPTLIDDKNFEEYIRDVKPVKVV